MTAGAGTRTVKQSLKRGRRSAIKKVVASSRDQTFVRVQDTKALTATSTRGQCHYPTGTQERTGFIPRFRWLSARDFCWDRCSNDRRNKTYRCRAHAAVNACHGRSDLTALTAKPAGC